MDIIFNIFVALCLIMFGYLFCRGAKEIRTANKAIKKLTENVNEITKKLNNMSDAYDDAQELIKAATEYTKEAEKTQMKLQVGIDNIINYDAMSAIKNGGIDGE